jgi:transcriptional regulator with XRE-family HTH domain
MSITLIRFSSYFENMGFRENLKSQLQYSGLLVKELADRSGIKKKTLDSYLGIRGYTPSVEAAVSIAQALGVSVEYLVTGREGPKERLLSSFPQDIQEVVHTLERMNAKDRRIVLTLASALRDR